MKIEGNDWRLGGFAGLAEYGTFDNCVAFGNVTSTVDGWEPHVGGFIGQSDNAIAANCHAAGTATSTSSDYKAGGFVGNYAGGTFTDCSFDSEKNIGLTASGTGIISSGVEGGSSNDVLANICEDYYEGHEYVTEWTTDTAATCTTDGSKSQHCERCDAKGNITVIPATGHNAVKTGAKAATCTEYGNIEYWYCADCGIYFSDEALTKEITKEETIVKATGHSFKDGKCTVCGSVDPNYVPTEPTKPTAPDKGDTNSSQTGDSAKGDTNSPQTGDSAKGDTNSPQTGDSANIVLWLVVMLAAGAVLTGTAIYSKKKKYSK